MSAYNHITRHAAKCGIKSNPTCGVAEQGADGPARRSSSVSRTWWTGPPPSSFTAGCRGPLQDGQAAKAKPLTRSCLRFWTRAWGQRDSLMNKPAAGLALLGLQGFSRVGWTSLPTTSNFSSLRREHPSWTLDASLRVTRWARANCCVCRSLSPSSRDAPRGSSAG